MTLGSFPWWEMLSPTGATTEIAIRLFRSSIFMVGNYITNEGGFSDLVTPYLHKIIPMSWQIAFREAGGISFFSDLGVSILAATTGLSNLQAVLDMFQVSRKISRFRYGPTPTHTLEIFRPVNSVLNITEDIVEKRILVPPKKPKTLVLVHGGAWGAGRLWQYRLVANGIGNIIGATTVVVVGYPTYPVANILEQRDCIAEALRFIRNSTDIQTVFEHNRTLPDKDDVNYDPNAIYLPNNSSRDSLVLCGHSSGANICALALLKEHQAITQSDSTISTEVTTTTASIPTHQTHPLVDVFVGMCGPYDITQHYLFEERRGVHVVSPMTAAAGGKAGLPLCSPTLVAHSMHAGTNSNAAASNRESSSNSNSGAGGCSGSSHLNLSQYKPPVTVLIHGRRDFTVPVSSSELYAQALTDLRLPNQLIVNESDHLQPLMEGLQGMRTPLSKTSVALRSALAFLEEQ